MKIWEQINKDNWCQNVLYCGNKEDTKYITSENTSLLCQKAEKCCAVGWLYRVYPEDIHRIEAVLKIGRHLQVDSIPAWNDQKDRTIEEVKTLFKELDL